MAHLDQASFHNYIKPLFDIENVGKLAIACSGGPDSMALAHLLRAWCHQHDIELVALIVDHALREGSISEALLVQERLKALDISAVVLRDENVNIQTNIQSEARNLRYRLLRDYCRKYEIAHMCLAHHMDDQAETFMLRLARGSGPSGLSAMKPVDNRNGITFLRPFLSLTKDDIIAYLKSQNLDWIEDPSNRLEKFDRVKIRNLSADLGKVGLTAERLSKTANIMADTQDALDWALQEALKDHLKIYDVGCYTISKKRLLELPKALTLKALSLMITSAAGQIYPPELSLLETVYSQLTDMEYGGTSYGAQLHSRGDILWIGREISRIEMTNDRPLDDRFSYDFPLGDFSIKPLGEVGWKTWSMRCDKTKKDCVYPAFIRNGIPALFDGETLIAPLKRLFPDEKAENYRNLEKFEIHFKIPAQFNNFAFSSACSDTM